MSGPLPAQPPIRELQLARASHDRRLYVLGDIGTIRREGRMCSNSYIAEADEHSWRFGGRGFLQRVLEATAVDGTVVGRFVPKHIKRGGPLDWNERRLTLQPASGLAEKYVLIDGARDLLHVAGRSWGRRLVTITVLGSDALEPGLVLFTAYVVHRLAVDASSTAGSIGAITAATTSS